MLKLIYGPSGSGKTASLINAIRTDIENGIRCFLLVPEQQAYISERDFPLVLPQNAGLFFEVVNFSGLAEDVFREYGGVTHRNADNGIRSLLMWDTLRTLSPLLRQYSKSAEKDTGLSAFMLQTIEELRSNGIDSDQLEEAAKALPQEHALSKKLYDLALINAAFRERMESVFGNDTSDKLLRMSKLLCKNAYFQNCHLYIDSFTSFTVQEYNVLREILKQAETVTIALCTNALHSPLPHFESVAETAKKLSKLAKEINVPIEKIKLKSHTNGKPKVLAALERDLWNFELSAKEKEKLPSEEKDAVRLLSCANIYEESDAAALQILDLVQNGMHYGDIAIVVRDTETYRGVLDAALERFSIPYFLSEATDLCSKPLARLILSALRCVTRHFHVQDVLTLVKTGLTGVDFADAAMFEEYCETWHLSGNRFLDPVWSMNPDGLTTERSARAEEILDAANRVRKALIEPLIALSTAMRASAKLTDRCRALYDYLSQLHISQQLSDRAKAELLAGQRKEAGETVRLYRFVTDTLASLCEALPDAELTIDELISALTLLFSTSSLASVPNLHDCVIIGSASTLRVENVRASLLLGLCEGEFPRALNDDGILTEGDKETLESLGIILNSRANIRSSEELLYVYRAMTKPSEKLCLFTVQSQLDGSARTPSLAFTRVCYLLDKKPDSFDSGAIHQLLKKENETFFEPRLQIPSAPAGTTLHLSQSKIRSFMHCPYSYFSTYELKLREKKDSRPSYADDGLFLHYVFEKFLKHALGDDGKLHLPSEKDAEPIADAIVEEYLLQVCPVPPEHMDSRLLHLFSRLRKLSLIMLRDILAELQMSNFVPSKFEQIIGMPKDGGLPAVSLELSNGSRVLLSGKVDRIDMFEKDETIYVRVVDYKSGTHKFSLDEVRSGMDIQLVLYLFAVLSSDKRMSPAGAQYLYAASDKGKIGIGRSGFLLNDEAVIQAADSSPDGAYTKKLLLQTQEEITQLTEEMNRAVKDAAERILAGEAQKTPSEKACMFCPVRTHCDKAYHK